MRRQHARIIWLTAAAALWVLALRDQTQAHTACQSRFTYNNEIFPIVRDRCGSCHVEGGAAPMSLVTFTDAFQWAASMRDELTAERMPPWQVDPASPAVKGGHPITANEIDMIVTWATCNAPHGDLAKTLPPVTYNPQWKLGPPDLKLQMSSAHTVDAGTPEETVDFSLPTGLTEPKWVKAVDLIPGTAPMVRDAVISVDNGPVLALWEPGSDTIAAPSGAAFRLPAGSNIHLQMHYKKSYLDEGKAMSDRSTVGIYFTEPPASGHEMQALTIDAPPASAGASGPRTFGGTFTVAARVVALRPMLDQPYESVDVTAVTMSGHRVPLLKLRPAWPQWFRRYWLQEPIELAAGSKIEVTATASGVDSDDPKPPKRFPLQVGLDYVPE